jgi:hypothetical protein
LDTTPELGWLFCARGLETLAKRTDERVKNEAFFISLALVVLASFWRLLACLEFGRRVKCVKAGRRGILKAMKRWVHTELLEKIIIKLKILL